MLEYIYVCRHGFRSNWVDPAIKTGPTGMNRDPPLAAHGLDQSAHLASYLSSPSRTAPYPTPEIVFTSPFYRCVQTALPTAQALGLVLGEGEDGLHLEHGLSEWYSPVYPSTGLHPRPGPPSSLIPHFPPGSINPTYSSTYYPSRKGESLKELHERMEGFLNAWVGRVEGEYPEVRCVVVFMHAASLIAFGRALTGDRGMEIVAGCASTSLYQRKPPPLPSPSTTQLPTPTTPSHPSHPAKARLPPCGTSQYTLLLSGHTSYLPSGLERDWSFADVVLKPGDGEVVCDYGDGEAHEGEVWEEGLAGGWEGMGRWVREGEQQGRGDFGVGERRARM
ncbi:transcription factor C subunit 7 [Cryptococcus wingfieldii CBS 7118]|uniref:Transcription factor C subunit 7 n=1 Tax=Cryptococcus wingfieldii CBS 7118 TaxID=1295528 RepID=A0A1E3INR0_9TREE|nr:transcription factor C subunit 7 [Cryptococcus wingfieldii CBS 7118]ODN90239.1 transcription factor C subunit 7 [Cryptococcus wingfieldii CBS 7118]